jgi:zinc protease
LYPAHPYNWPTIGKTIAHIETAKLRHVKAFYEKHYRPDQAILSICGDIDYANTEALVAQYFGSILKEDTTPYSQFDYSSVGNPTRSITIEADVPSKAIVIAFKMSDRLSNDYYVADLISDILSSGRSSRLYQVLIKEKELFSSIDAYISSTFDDGAFVVDGKLNEGVSIEQAKLAIWEQLDRMKDNFVDEVELQKIKNKAESSIIFSETSILSKAMSLGYYEYLGNIDLINDEYQMYLNVTSEDIKRVSNVMFNADQCVELIYLTKSATPA